jgi:hypothetical protein
MHESTDVKTRTCPNCGGPMHFISFGTVIEQHHLTGLLEGLQIPMVAHPRGWKCVNPTCEYFEPAAPETPKEESHPHH